MNRPRKGLYTFPALLLLLTLLAAMAHTMAPPAQAAEVLIDTFAYTSTEADYTIPDPLPTFPVLVAAASGTGVSEVLGGQRDICLEVLEGLSGSRARFRTDAVNDYLDMDLSSGVRADAVVQWDGGANGDCTLAPAGLGGLDLTDGGTNEGVLLRVVASDSLLVVIHVRLYTDATHWSEHSLTFESRVQSPSQAVDIFLPFADFTEQGDDGPANPASVGAVELELDASAADSAGADMTIKMFKAASIHDYGDLPNDYGSAMLNARHIVQGMRLGYSVDAEVGSSASALADGDDDNDFDDEDGVTRAGRWDPDNEEPSDEDWIAGDWEDGHGGTVEVTWNGCAANGQSRCRVVGWIDWDDDGVLEDDNERVVYSLRAGAGSAYIPFDIPAGTSFDGVRYYARFRICPSGANACVLPDANNVRNGEVEDYAWDWSPTAVKLTSFTAAPAGGAVRVAWETASEQDNAGFHLYRSTVSGTQGERLNQYLIPSAAPGGGLGAVYGFLDTTAQPGQTYYYTLVDVDLFGVSTPHGPIAITTPYTVFLPLLRR